MLFYARGETPRHIRRLLFGVLLAGLIAIFAPASSRAAVTTFGSPLSVPATLNTAVNLGYQGTNTDVPPSPEAPNGVVHTYHYGADTALWNTDQAVGSPRAPMTGQALKVSLEGCAQSTPGGPPPLTQIHLQDISPLPGGGAKVNLTSQAFSMPVCGQGGASGSTITAYEPINLCVSQGDYVAFNDEGGFVEHAYQSGVAYQVLGSARGSTFASFIRDDGTDNGDTLSSLDSTSMDGFSSNPGEELMLQVTLGTGQSATHICAGGTAGLPPVLAPIRVSPQTDGVNHAGVVSVAVFCRVSPECKGVATLSTHAGLDTYGHTNFSLRPERTMHLPIRVSSQLVRLIRSKHGVSTTLTVALGGTKVSQLITLKIF
jgi:hypothetical protein